MGTSVHLNQLAEIEFSTEVSSNNSSDSEMEQDSRPNSVINTATLPTSRNARNTGLNRRNNNQEWDRISHLEQSDNQHNNEAHTIEHSGLYSMLMDHECLFTLPLSPSMTISIFARDPEELASIKAGIERMMGIFSQEETEEMFANGGIICSRSLLIDNGIEIPDKTMKVNIYRTMLRGRPIVCHFIGYSYPNLPMSSLRRPTNEPHDEGNQEQLSQRLSELRNRILRSRNNNVESNLDAMENDSEDEEQLPFSQMMNDIPLRRIMRQQMPRTANAAEIIELDSDDSE